MSENKEPLVTTVITTYKRKPEIVKRALDSIVGQTYDNIEIFVVNDCPTDKKLIEDLKNTINNNVYLNFISRLFSAFI